MNFNFDWNYVAAGAPYVTVSELGLAFNAPAITLLGNPEEIAVGFDEDQMTIGVTDARNVQDVLKTYKFSSRMRTGWVRIGCKDFVKYLSLISGMKFSPSKKFIAQYDHEEKILFVTIKEEGEEDIKTE